MVKYVDTLVGFAEVPDEISLCINISNCHFHCNGCHSQYLWEDIGTPLTEKALIELIGANKGITCVCFMGGELKDIVKLCSFIKKNTYFKTCWYTGLENVDIKDCEYFDYLKTGPYIEELGPLNSPTTNQRFYLIKNKQFSDITYKFNKNETKN